MAEGQDLGSNTQTPHVEDYVEEKELGKGKWLWYIFMYKGTIK